MYGFLMRFSKSLIVNVLFLILIYLFLFSEHIKIAKDIANLLPSQIFNLNTIFLGIIIEAIPFILLGVIASSIIQIFVSEKVIQKVMPKHALLAMIPATLLGIIFPICECAIIPVVRRLIKKGLPQHISIVFMLSVPALNPVVYLSTYYAFQNNHIFLFGRMILSFLAAITIGMITYVLFRDKTILKHSTLDERHMNHGKSWTAFFKHVSDEFFDTGKYLVFGALLASLFHTFLNRNVLDSIRSHQLIAPAVMMGFSYVLSVCSEADAFVASSFIHSFNTESILAFLVIGPMLDLKNTIMLFAYFRFKFVSVFIISAVAAVYGLSQILHFFI
ncbi:permease [Heyndrickxia ginsengihumi]|uniref:permease n=1 Tax=Heyndrickxia ginsengihumi TaxID=363870 RepID=UPI000472EC69|nr:permease [Heyndrickxia ginsengihumi]